MTTIHKNLTGADLHEPKGVASATSAQVYVSDGAGSGVWTTVANLVTAGGFSTGDLKPTHKTSADSGWILWSDGTIGDGSSSATIRANSDTQNLFTLYWANANCLISGGKGVSAASDWAAHKAIALPPGAGRALGLAGSGSGLTTRAVGATVGNETFTITTTNLPAYTPIVSQQPAFSFQWGAAPHGSSGAPAIDNLLPSGITGGTTLVPVRTADVVMAAQGGNSTAFSLMQPSAFVNVMVKL